MNLTTLFKKILPYVKPYRFLVAITLFLTLIGSILAQVNAVVVDWTVDSILLMPYMPSAADTSTG